MALDLNGPLAQEVMKRVMDENGQAAPKPEEEGIGKLAKIIFGSGLGADMATTMYGQAKGLTNEANPMLSWAGKYASPVGAGMELGGVLLANKLLGEKHPKIMKALLMGLGGMHGGAAIHNMNEMGKARNAQDEFNRTRPDIPEPVATEYRNPDLFPPSGR